MQPLSHTEELGLLNALESAHRGDSSKLHEVLTPQLVQRLLDERWANLQLQERLRQAIAYEAGVVQAHYEGYKSFPKTRRGIAEEQVKRLGALADGRVDPVFDERYRRMKLGNLSDSLRMYPMVEIDYTNHAGERALRRIQPLRLRYGTTPKQDTPRWLIDGIDIARDVERSFSLKNLHSWTEA